VKGVGKYDTGTTVFNGFVQQYRGGFINPNFSGDSVPDSQYNNPEQFMLSQPNLPSMSSYEPQVWSRTKPPLQSASGFVFLAELRDAPHMLRSLARDFKHSWKSLNGNDAPMMGPSDIASRFLNEEFGWAPIIGDLKKFYDTYQKSETLLTKLRAGNDKWVRRRAVLAKTQSSSLIASGEGMRCSPSGFSIDACCEADGLGRKQYWTLHRETITRVWSEGSFRYYLPQFDFTRPDYSSSYQTAMRYITLYGLRVNPINVYKAIPWTWLIDWVSKMGDNISRFNDIYVDSMAARWLYLMHHEIKTIRLTQMINFRGNPVSLSWVRVIESKQRKSAPSPYGFGLTWAGLSPHQLSLLLALGISKGFKGSPGN
jgi:hypothetical protein